MAADVIGGMVAVDNDGSVGNDVLSGFTASNSFLVLFFAALLLPLLLFNGEAVFFLLLLDDGEGDLTAFVVAEITSPLPLGVAVVGVDDDDDDAAGGGVFFALFAFLYRYRSAK